MLKNEYTKTNLITYIGNKRKLLDDIESEIIKIKGVLNKELITSFDGFSGSGSISRMLKYHSSNLIVNDLEEYSYRINKCYLSDPSDEQKQVINKIITELNNMEYNVEGAICKEYSPKDTNNIQEGERAFYTRENALIIDTIRSKIDSYPKEYFNYLIAPLLVKASINTNTSGVFKGFHKKSNIGHFGGKDEVNTESRIIKKIVLDPPLFSDHSHKCDVSVYKKDINKLIHELPMIIDIAYLDPPYNQHPYGSNYFMLNTIINNKVEEDISKVSGIPKKWNRSEYNYKKTALQSMRDLISGIRALFIIISYNNEGIITEQDMVQLICDLDYKYELKKIKYNAYRGSRNLQNRDTMVEEYLWIINKSESIHNLETIRSNGSFDTKQI